MTLDIQKWLTQLIKTQQKIAHNDVEFQVFKTEKIPHKVMSNLQEQFGESYFLDSQYVIFFKDPDGKLSAKDKKKLFEIVDKSLGKQANNSTINDFKDFDKGKVGESSIAEDDDEEDDGEEAEVKQEPAESSAGKAGYSFIKITLK